MQSAVNAYLESQRNTISNTRAGVEGAIQNLAKPDVVAPQVTGPQVNVGQAAQGFGVADPRAALGQLLSGQVDTVPLGGMHQAYIDRANRNYNTQLENLYQQLTTSILPNIGRNAAGAGSYGSSRQGIAEGLALQQYLRSLGTNAGDLALGAYDSGQVLYGNAFQQAQQLKGTAAGQMASQVGQIAGQNATMDLQGQVANATNALNAQQLNQQGLGQAITGYGALQQADTNTLNNAIGALTAPYTFNQGVLQNQANVTVPIGKQGVQQTQTTPNNTVGQIIGGATAGLGASNLLTAKP
jgi:hypothetical protein